MKKTSLLLLITTLCLSVVLGACSNNNNTGNTGNQSTSKNTSTGEEAPRQVKLSILAWNNEKEMKPVLDGFQ